MGKWGNSGWGQVAVLGRVNRELVKQLKEKDALIEKLLNKKGGNRQTNNKDGDNE